MPATWRLAVRALDLVGFGPHAQDQAALYLIKKRGAMQLADRGVLPPQLAVRFGGWPAVNHVRRPVVGERLAANGRRPAGAIIERVSPKRVCSEI